MNKKRGREEKKNGKENERNEEREGRRWEKNGRIETARGTDAARRLVIVLLALYIIHARG